MHHSRTQLFFGLKLAAFSVFLGRGLQHFVGETPYRAFFWDQSLFQLTGNNWSYFSNVLFSDHFIDNLTFILGIYFIICSIIVWKYLKLKSPNKILKTLPAKNLILSGTFLLFLLALLHSKDHFYELAQFLEYMIQSCSPLFLLYFISKGYTSQLELAMKVALSLTFASHGVYAIGFLPVPIHFMEMTMEILRIDENSALYFLTLAGIMDFIVAIMVFMPHKINQSALIYMMLWGMMTAFARTLYPLVGMDFSLHALLIGISETILRFPHFIIAMILLVKK